MLNKLRQGLRALFFKSRFEHDLDEEVRFHLGREVEENIARGMGPEEARSAALRSFGGVERVKDESRDERGLRFLEEFWHDLRYGLRVLRKAPGFTLTAVLTLALGIGATTTMFSVVYNILFSPFIYREPDRIEDLMVQDLDKPRSERGALIAPEFLDYLEQSTVFEEVFGSNGGTVIYTSNEGPEQFRVSWVTPNAFHFLGVAPIIGRPITPEDGKPGAPLVIVLRYSSWLNRFGGEVGVLGKTLVLNGTDYTIIGVMPPRFTWDGPDAWIPSALDRSDPEATTTFRWFHCRLKSGVSSRQAIAELNLIAQRAARDYPQYYPKRFAITLRTTVDRVVGRFRGVLYTLMTAVGVLLLIACCNAANMLLARATAREKEISIRVALGAGHRRVIRQLLTESLLLALLGAVIGCLLAYAGVKSVPGILPPYVVPSEVEIALSLPVLLFCLGVTLLTSLLFGLAPTFHAVRRNVVQGLGDSVKGSGGGSAHGKLRNILVAGEVALSLALLFSGGLLMRSFISLIKTDLGVRTENLLAMSMIFPAGQYLTAAKRQAFFSQVAPRLAALPGVSSVAIANGLPPWGGLLSQIEIPDRPQINKTNAMIRLCGEIYFQTVGYRLLSGRLLGEPDVVNARRVAVINQTLALRYFGVENPLGRRISLPSLASPPDPVMNPVFEVVGVVSDAKNMGIQDPVQPEVFLPHTLTGKGARYIVVHSAMDPSRIVQSIRNEIYMADRSVGSTAIIMDDWLRTGAFSQPRFSLILLSIFAGMGLMMVSVGVYSVMNYSVSLRSHEIGIRIALGAARSDVIFMVLRSGARVLAIGISVGLLVCLACGRLIADQFGLRTTHDPIAMAAGVIVIVVVGIAACLRPARRASRVDPITALRSE
ncbi:MAG: ABC transporter permease [Chloracidobacterium sp.]|nr:ABC transporter permease [Chloracidobacterium sp.]